MVEESEAWIESISILIEERKERAGKMRQRAMKLINAVGLEAMERPSDRV